MFDLSSLVFLDETAAIENLPPIQAVFVQLVFCKVSNSTLFLRDVTMVLHVPPSLAHWLQKLLHWRDFQIEANGVTRRALQPTALSECRKINSCWGTPSRRAIAGAKLQSDFLVAIGNPQRRVKF